MNTNDPPGTPLSDSPWFWLLLFSATAIFALLVVSPKYVRRQGRLIRQFEARRQHRGMLPRESQEDDTHARKARSRIPEASGVRRRFRLTPLVLLAVLVLIISGTMLVVSRRWPGKDRSDGEPP